MVLYKEQMVQRPLNLAIVDEVDSILIDEARTPLIISGGAKSTANLYRQAHLCVRNMIEEEDFEIDIKSKHIALTRKGWRRRSASSESKTSSTLSHVNLLHH